MVNSVVMHNRAVERISSQSPTWYIDLREKVGQELAQEFRQLEQHLIHEVEMVYKERIAQAT